MKNRGMLASLVTIPLTGLLLAGCSANTTAEAQGTEEPAAGGKVEVVTTMNVYGQIARAVGGEHVEVTEIITSTAQDPHSYEPTARDKLTVSKASIVLANGGGYDQFMDSLVSSLPAEQAEQVQLIHAVDSSPVAAEHEEGEAHAEHEGEEHAEHEHEGEEHAEHEHAEEAADDHAGHDHAEYNEHIWYDLDSMEALAASLATELGESDPENAETFKANAASFAEGIGGLQEQLASAKLGKRSYAMTEPVPFHLLEDAGMENKTPAGLSEAVEAGEGIAPLTLKSLSDTLDAGELDVLAYNVQTEGPETTALRASAESGKVAVVDFRETITDDSSYLEWMEKNISSLASAIGE
ncbi:metal ABC transporter substrate-binding protein [Arthrobacter sp. MYb211]|uniref:metal ABC transporter solute-binding protein, Zn/Mn family n=1 Tax=Micrococcaceae TaxID=1268 RepID=UPI000CFBC960|nr:MULTISPECIES: zinc ABC transporter substrate-binding protein [unclassified Arthrobacter]PQZ99679.1 metal ABC transporter substrate-binding protein [Arthrobacter sp. MYb224]PRA05854.1 metal ABC transporter substrate-binding protein [Arthrobacter sp. MYb229]PRA11374.1 metal ABC transporter substrate-binding protein [Arthrobacter sp. MYb221]PRB52755.1 metal ABC transporter substrate-binding protein [Arthrobacter sp. MYb216]PRC07453.1 metal ABC transporter substrate-binding protein [Arthrobacte